MMFYDVLCLKSILGFLSSERTSGISPSFLFEVRDQFSLTRLNHDHDHDWDQKESSKLRCQDRFTLLRCYCLKQERATHQHLLFWKTTMDGIYPLTHLIGITSPTMKMLKTKTAAEPPSDVVYWDKGVYQRLQHHHA